MYIFSFEKLDVWKNTIELTKIIYRISSKFPDKEKFGLTSQMRRAVVSVSSNIAEGTSRTTGKDKSHYTTMAYTSLMELMNQSIVSNALDYISNEDLNLIREKVAHIANQLNSLRNFQKNN